MTAPALIAVARGGPDPRIKTAAEGIVAELRRLRPDLRVELAFIDQCRPSIETAVIKLRRAHFDEAVIVPLVLNAGLPELKALPGQVADIMAAYPDIRLRCSDVVGMEQPFLTILDERLRTALRRARVRELDALVLAAAGVPDPLVNQAVCRLARVWGARHHLPVSAAFASTSPPSTAEAVRAFRREGRRHVAVGSLFLTPEPLGELAAELAFEAGAVAVSDPLGAHPEVARTVLARYAVGAVELVPV